FITMQRARVSNHPCHRLSVPAAKRFWCRHCMMVFEDAITRWRHSRSCRSGGFDNFIRRREIETQALQKMAETLDPEMAMGPIPLPTGEAVAGCSKELCCFICRQRFMSLDEMREHVKYPCNKPANLQRPSMTVYIEEPTFGTGIQQHFTDGPGVRPSTAASGHHETTVDSSGTSSPHPVAVYMNDSEEAHAQGEAKPTNIYVNEKGETVIEVENLDLNTKSGELSLAHLLTQLSQQGIVFDQQASSGSENNLTQGEPVIQGTLQELDLSQPTAVDAANTLTQLAGSAFRAASHPQTDDIYSYAPPTKRVKSECIEVQYPSEQVDQAVETEMPKDGIEVSDAQNYIICTDESEVISVVRAGSVEHDTSQNSTAVDTAVFQGSSDDDASRQVYHAAQYNVASQESVGQQTASGSEPTSQTVLVKHADEDYNPVQDGEQVDEFTDSTQISVRIPPTVDHLEQLDVTSSQMSGNGSAPISLEHHDNMQPQEDPDLVSGQPEGVCKNSSMPGDSTTDVPAATFNVSNPQGSSAEQLESSVGPQSETGFLLPQIVSVSSTVPEMPVTPVQQTPSAASPNTSPKALCGAQNSLNSLSSPVEVVTESSFPGKAADPAKSSRDKVTCKQGVSFNLIADPEESVEGEKEQRHTRLMSQKVLRPRPAAVHKPAHKPRPKIRLWDKRVNVSGLGEQEQFLFEVGLVKTAHMSPDMLLRHRAVIRSKVAIHRLRHAEARAQQAALKVFVPENIVIHSESCPSSPDGYNSPPVLERMDLNVILREYEEPLASDLDPPVLEPMIDGPHVEFSQMQSLSFASVPEGRNGTQNENSESAVFVKQYYDICPELSASLLPYVSSSAEKSVVKITIKSVASGVRLAEGGEIIIKTPYNSDRILLINPQEDCEDYSPRYSPRPADLNRTGSSKESADHLFRANSNPSHSQSKCSPFAGLFLMGVINNLPYVIVNSASNTIADSFGEKNLVGLVFGANVALSVFVKGLFGVAYAFNFGFALACIVVVGSTAAFGENVTLGFLSRFPSKMVNAWSSGTGMAGLLGGSIYVLF
ncbi:hypothetical protein BaRGS_00017256, partial [Batillaria attramentaria]